nr:LysM peptidoglycan-binding domain-containing protein [Acinetobacter sp. Marseille-Q1620]
MNSIFKGIHFNALGLKKYTLMLAVCAGIGLVPTYSIQAASPNINPPSLKANAPHVYIVKKGDTLWDISAKFLKKPWRWPEIWASNKHVKNPHWIYPGDRLLLCSLNGQPLIGKDEGDGCTGIIQRYTGKKVTSIQPRVRIEELANTIPVISLSEIEPWLVRNTIFNAESIQHLPYVLGTEDKRIIAAKGQKIYIRGEGLKIGQQYTVYRQNEPYVFKGINGKKINAGTELEQVASGLATELKNDIATLELTESFTREVRKGDLILPLFEAELPSMFYPTSKNEIVHGGHIIRVMGAINRAAQRSVVTVDRGTLQGAKVGQVFSIAQRGEIVKDPKTKKNVELPQQQIGHLMLFKTFDNLSYAYVLDSSLPIQVGASIQSTEDED